MTLDVRAFWLIGALVSCSCGLLALIVRKTYPNHLGRVLAIFGAANLCLSLNYGIRLERAWTGEFLFNVMGGTLVAACMSMEYAGVCLLKRRRARIGWIVGPPLLVFLVSTWFTVVERNVSIDLLIGNVTDMVLMGLIAFSLTRKEDGQIPFIDLVTAAAYALMAAAACLVIADALKTGRFSPEVDFNIQRSIFNNITGIMAEGIIFPLFLLMLSERLNRALVIQAMRDPLTNIYNRRAFEEIAFREISGASRSGLHLSLLMFDLDHFKEINDEHGHLTGDAVLRAVSAVLRDGLRDEDFLCRWGGDEFCALLPRAKAEQAEVVARRVLQAFEDFAFPREGKAIKLSVSIGIVSDEGQARNLSDLVLRADAALYQAKDAGRKRFALAPPGSVEQTVLPTGPILRRAGGRPTA
jgi:diguanylate cyclase (GGDEF)-like protein